jgi:uncharacterized protein YkwD
VDDGVMTIALAAGDTLMCDWYRFPGGVTADTAEGGDEEDAGANQGADRDGDGLFDDDEEQVYNTDPATFDTDGAVLDANCLDPEEATFLTMLNDLRAQTGAPPVLVSGTLTRAAEAHSQDMITRNFFDHINPDGEDFQDRILAAGYVEGSASRFAENIQSPPVTGREAFDNWAGGADQYRTMVDPELVAIGIARVEVPDSDFGWYWTTTHANQFDVTPDC